MHDTWHVLGGPEVPRVKCRCSQTSGQVGLTCDTWHDAIRGKSQVVG